MDPSHAAIRSGGYDHVDVGCTHFLSYSKDNGQRDVYELIDWKDLDA
jgi:hypothetical protein